MAQKINTLYSAIPISDYEIQGVPIGRPAYIFYRVNQTNGDNYTIGIGQQNNILPLDKYVKSGIFSSPISYFAPGKLVYISNEFIEEYPIGSYRKVYYVASITQSGATYTITYKKDDDSNGNVTLDANIVKSYLGVLGNETKLPSPGALSTQTGYFYVYYIPLDTPLLGLGLPFRKGADGIIKLPSGFTDNVLDLTGKIVVFDGDDNYFTIKSSAETNDIVFNIVSLDRYNNILFVI